MDQYYALRVQIGNEHYKHHVVQLSHDGVLIGHYPFERESEQVKYVAGKLVVIGLEDTPQRYQMQHVKADDHVMLWKLEPYDLQNDQTLPETRAIKMK